MNFLSEINRYKTALVSCDRIIKIFEIEEEKITDREIELEGNIEFKSDNRGLFEYSIISLNQYPMDIEYISLDLHNSPESEINIMTEYERKFCEKGPIYKLVARYRKNG